MLGVLQTQAAIVQVHTVHHIAIVHQIVILEVLPHLLVRVVSSVLVVEDAVERTDAEEMVNANTVMVRDIKVQMDTTMSAVFAKELKNVLSVVVAASANTAEVLVKIKC